MTRRPIAKAGASFARAGEAWVLQRQACGGVKRERWGLTSICPKRVENVWSAGYAARQKEGVAIGGANANRDKTDRLSRPRGECDDDP